MLLSEIIEKHVKPLSRMEKWQLIQDVQKMLMKEDVSELERLSMSKDSYPLFTPVGLEDGASKLQEYLREGKL